MKHLLESLSVIFSRTDSRRVIVGTTLLFLFLLLAFQNGTSSFALLSFSQIPLATRFGLFVSTFFDITNTFTSSSLILAVLGSLVGGINLSLAYTYMCMRGEVIVHSGLYSGLGLFVAFLGIGCAACGTAFLSVLLSFLGFSSVLGKLPYEGMEVGYIGLLILCIATYALSKKVATPNVC
jgi:hypothetical protein